MRKMSDESRNDGQKFEKIELWVGNWSIFQCTMVGWKTCPVERKERAQASVWRMLIEWAARVRHDVR